MVRTCCFCKEVKDTARFYKSSKGAFSSRCIKCHKLKDPERNLKLKQHRQFLAEANMSYCISCKTEDLIVNLRKKSLNRLQCSRCYEQEKLKYLYNLDLEEYEEMLEIQNGLCALCQRPSKNKLQIDHDHNCCSGKRCCGKCIRGLLCSNCNIALANLKDNPITTWTAFLYLGGKIEQVFAV